MTITPLFVVVTKLAGVLVTLTVAANEFSFSRFRKKNLCPFISPIDESYDTLAVFSDKDFFFGLATAPAHVEDRLDDAWLQFAKQEDDETAVAEEETDCEEKRVLEPSEGVMAAATSKATATFSNDGAVSKVKKPVKIAMEAMIRGFQKYTQSDSDDDEHHQQQPPPAASTSNVAAWHNVPNPEQRLMLWSDPDTEILLAKATGITVFRMGVDWTRIMPREPLDGLKESVNYAALERYKWIIGRVRFHGMKVMLTLFHHSLPPWAGKYGGWKLEKTVDYFMDFTRLVVESLSDMVDYWITFNEPHVFCMLTYCAGAWPGGNPDMLEVATSTLPTGVFKQSMHLIGVAHSKAYEYIHKQRFIFVL